MKKLLLISTALVAGAGAAAAQDVAVSISGGARFVLRYTDPSVDNVTSEMQIDTIKGNLTAAREAYEGRADDPATTADEAVVGSQAALSAAAATLNASKSTANAEAFAEAGAQALVDEAALATAQAAYDAIVRDPGSDTNVFTRYDINVDGSVQSDVGIEFFGRFRIRGQNTDEENLSAGAVSAPRVGLKVGTFTLAFGNINGAVDSAPGVYSGAVGFDAANGHNLFQGASYAGFSSQGAGAHGAEVIFDAGDFTFHVSHGLAEERTGIYLSYDFGNFLVAGIAQRGSENDNADLEGVLVNVDLSDAFEVGVAYARVNELSRWRAHLDFEVADGTSIIAHVADRESGSVGGDDSAAGIGFEHSLGGATLVGGIGRGADESNAADLGVRFSF